MWVGYHIVVGRFGKLGKGIYLEMQDAMGIIVIYRII